MKMNVAGRKVNLEPSAAGLDDGIDGTDDG